MNNINNKNDFGRLQYNLVLGRWFFNYGWAWVIGFLLSWVNTLTVVYFLIPGIKELMSFKMFIIVGSLIFIVLSTFLGWLLIMVWRVQSIETKIGTDINPYAHTKLTRKELVLWRLIISTAEEVSELSERINGKNKEKHALFKKRIDRAREFLSNTQLSKLDLKPHFEKEE